LRVLQEGEIKRIGETKIRKVDVRIIAATNRDLEKMMREQNFREDLYYRLNVVLITLPPLRERENDALLLSEHFVEKYAGKFSKKVKKINREAKCVIATYPWPGNVRELEHAIERAVIMAGGQSIEINDLPEKLSEAYFQGKASNNVIPQNTYKQLLLYRDKLSQIASETERIEKALEIAEGNREKAAVMLGVSRTTLWRRLRELKAI
ncbi:MAG: AAA-type ATPase lid domain-containing protein, partial [Planctomycetota bacterium]